MLKFKEFPYTRIDFECLSENFKKHIDAFLNAESYGEAFYHFVELDHIEKTFISYATISEAGNTNNSYDEFFMEEETFFNSIKPKFELLIKEKDSALLNSKFVNDFTDAIGTEYINSTKMKIKTVSEDIIELMQYENSLSQNYSTMVSQLKVVHEGKELNLSQISKYMNHSDRKIRKQYNALYDKAWLSIAKDLDELFDKLVKVRHEIALKTGFNNHTEYCFHKHGRTSYGRQELLVFSNNVESFISPLVNEMYKTQEKNFGHEIFSYDENFFVNKIDLNTDKDLISSFKKIFQSLSPQTHVFYEELVDREMYDVGLRDGKLMGAYSNYMPLFSMPYIFESYNGSFGAINTFAHECGHGLNSFMHRGDVFLNKASSDVYESHSMSMEFFVWPYINNIINEEQIPYYKYNKLRNALSFICYGTAIDQFQTMVYDKPEMTPEERLSLWKNLENRFLPWRKYESDGFNYQGRRWQQQIHVMRWPFYYIDYVLAQVCALQFWLKDEKCHETAWEKYIMFIKNSGGMSFLELVNSAQLKSPFNKESIIEISTSVKNYLDTVLNEVI